MLNLNNVYNHYSPKLLAPKQNSKFRSHKPQSLKDVYKNMIKLNQNSPLYKFSFTDATQIYAISIKEAALSLEAESSVLGGHTENIEEEMMIISSNENVLYASLNSNDTGDLPDKLSIKVESLATGQTNVGDYLPSGESSFTSGNYSFGISTERNQYTFNLSIREDDTNLQIQENLADSINANNIGIHASIRNNRLDGTSALVLRSTSTGLPTEDDLFFHFDDSYLKDDITSILGIDHVESKPANARFYINGDLHTSISNRISLNHTLDIDLLSTSDSPVTVSLVPDNSKTSDRLDNFLRSYNQLIDLSRSGTDNNGATRLFRDVTSITRHNQKLLSSAGFISDENGYLTYPDEIDGAKIRTLFEDSSSFRKDIKRITEKMSLNPLDYIDKVIITYPNTTKNHPNPYFPAKYSGLLFNDYA